MSDLEKWLATFCRKRRTEPRKYVLDGFDGDFCLVFDCEDDPETPEAAGRCDILYEPLPHRSPDYVADRCRIVSNANKHGVMRMLAALGIQRFNEKAKAAYYELANPLRGTTNAELQA